MKLVHPLDTVLLNLHRLESKALTPERHES